MTATRWSCEVCGRDGAVTMEADTAVFDAIRLIWAAHHKASRKCSNPVERIRVSIVDPPGEGDSSNGGVQMTDQEMADAIGAAVEFADNEGMFESGDDARVRGVRTFEDAGLLTRDAGIVLRLADGSEYQITVVRSA